LTKRKIIFHIGQPKTGSSALQAFLSVNANRLAECGIGYPFPEGESTVASGYCTGNVVHTMQSIARSNGDGSHPEKLGPISLFENYFLDAINLGLRDSNESIVLFSAEGLSAPFANFALPVFRQLNMAHEVEIVCFVRDPYDFAISAWKQGVKTGRRTEDFETFIRSRIEKKSFGLETVATYVPAVSDAKLINYDTHRKDIFTPFLRAIGVSDKLGKFKVPSNSQTTPSVSYSQATALVQARKIVRSPLFYALLTKRFRSQKESAPDPYIRKLDQLIMDYMKESLERLNDLLPDGQKLRTTVRDEDDLLSEKVSLEILRSVMEVANEASELNTKRSVSRKLKGLPADFDPLVYLLLNPDLEAAGVDPASHYLNNGRFEARRYS